MDNVWYFLLLILVITVLIAARVYSDRLDRRRIREHVAHHGGKVLNISWNPLGGSWSRTRSGRFYDVRYSTKARRQVLTRKRCARRLRRPLSRSLAWPVEPGFLRKHRDVPSADGAIRVKPPREDERRA